MKKLLCAVMASVTALTSIVISVPAVADSELSYGDFSYKISGTELIITKYNGNDSYVVVPDEINGKAVTIIGEGAFSGNETLEYISLPNKLEMILEGSFYGCTNLQTIVLPNSVKKIGGKFYTSSNEYNEDTYFTLAHLTFSNCTSLNEFVMGDNVDYIGKATFYLDTTLGKISFSPSVKELSPSGYFSNVESQLNEYDKQFSEAYIRSESGQAVYWDDIVVHFPSKNAYISSVSGGYDADEVLSFIGEYGEYSEDELLSFIDEYVEYGEDGVLFDIIPLSDSHAKVTFNTNGGDTKNSELWTLRGQSVSEEIPPEKEDCDFLGWYKNPECTGEPWDFVFDKVYEDTTLYAKWCPKQYTLTFDSTGGTSAGSIDVSFGTAIGDMPTPTKSGYQFAGWYTREKGNGDLYTPDNIMPKSDIKLYAAWVQNGKSLMVDFDTNGGKGSVEKCLVGYNETIDSFPTVKRTGYTFVEWNSKPDGTGAHVSKKTKIIYNNLKLYAVWKPNPCTVTLNANKGTVTKDKLTVNYDSKIGTLETPVREAYEFLGWYYADGTKCSPNDIITNNVKLTAKWRGYEYMILLNPKGGKMSEEDTRNVCCGDSVGELPVPTRKGYYFLGWFTKPKAKGTQYTAETEMPEKDITLYAGWKKKSGYATSVSLDVKSLSLGVGQSQDLTATLTPIATLDTLSWTSSNTKVATVSSTGNVTAKGAGTATITVKTTKGKTASVKITVKKAVTKLTASYNSRTIKADQTVKATVKANGYAGTLKWTSSNPSVVTVDQNGNITGVKAGKATVTIKAYNGITTEITIIVK